MGKIVSFRALAVGALFVANVTSVGAAPLEAIRAGDMQQLIPEIIAIYEDTGLSWDHGIEWQVAPFTTTFWFYDPNTSAITVGAMPVDSEIAIYWENWSDALTEGNFTPGDFFSSETEAGELARYNQYVLATHESAHAITFRYDYGHLARHDYAINCREYYADRLTVAILNEQARLSSDMRRWRDRYHELVVAMGDTIPEQYRYHVADFAALDGNCAVIDVAQPTPETMQPYASAYFERYRVLFEAELPSMQAIFRSHLSDVWDEVYKAIPFAVDLASHELITLAELEEVKLGSVYGDDLGEFGMRSRAAAFDADGTLWFATLSYDRDTHMAQLAFGADPLASPMTGEPAKWGHASVRLQVTSLAVLSADRFLVALEHWDRDGVDSAERFFVTWLLASRTDGAWLLESITEEEGLAQGVVLRSPDNRLFLIATPDSRSGEGSANWVEYELSLEKDAILDEFPVSSSFQRPLAIDAETRLYEEHNYLLWRSAPDGSDDVVIGNGHLGPRDGVGNSAELSNLQVMQWMADGHALIIDRGLGYSGWIRRELRPALSW